jgi:hypothetical protein
MGLPDQSEYDITVSDWERVAKAKEIITTFESEAKSGRASE